MGEYRVDGKDSPPVTSPEEMAGRFQAELMTLLPGWKQRLLSSPEQLPELERNVHTAFSRGADLLVVGLLSLTMKNESFDEAARPVAKTSPIRWNAAVRARFACDCWVAC
jgi:hypothetical protein